MTEFTTTDDYTSETAIIHADATLMTLEEWLASVGLYHEAGEVQRVRYELARWRNRIAPTEDV